MSQLHTALDKQNIVEEIFQYFTLYIADEILGIDLQQVKEVIEVGDITILPRTPNYMRGVINLRGQIIPIIDLKLKFDMGKTEFTVDSCIIIIEIIVNEEPALVGALADSVRDVVSLNQKDIDPAPNIGSAIDSKFISGMARDEDEFFILINIEELFSIEELLIGTATGAVSPHIS